MKCRLLTDYVQSEVVPVRSSLAVDYGNLHYQSPIPALVGISRRSWRSFDATDLINAYDDGFSVFLRIQVPTLPLLLLKRKDTLAIHSFT